MLMLPNDTEFPNQVRIAILFALAFTCATTAVARENTISEEPIPAAGDSREAVIEKLESATCAITVGKPALANIRGSGVFVSEDGYLLTAGHVIKGPKGNLIPNIYVYRNIPGEKMQAFHSAEIVKFFGDGENQPDLALLKIKLKDGGYPLSWLEIGGLPDTGEEILIAGFPLVFDKIYGWPLFRFGEVASNRYTLRKSKVLVLDITSVSGFSGSPVVHRKTGKLVAILKGRATGDKSSDYTLATIVEPANIRDARN